VLFRSHWQSLQKTIHSLSLAAKLPGNLLDKKGIDPITRGELGFSRRTELEQSEYDPGHHYLTEEESEIMKIDNAIDALTFLGGRGLDPDDIENVTENIILIDNFIKKTQSTLKEFLESVAAQNGSIEGQLFECLSSYLEATEGYLHRSRSKQIRTLGAQLLADRDALIETLQLSPDRPEADFDFWPPPEIEDLFINY